MKRWIQRTLIGLVGAGALLGGLAAWAGYRHHHGWHGIDDERRAELRAHAVERAARHLELDAQQTARLEALAETLHRQRKAIVGATDPKAELMALVAGTTFDRTRAGALLETKLALVHQQAPEAINALADFYDGLRPDQQERLRAFMARGRHGRGG